MLIIIEDNNDNVTTAIVKLQQYSKLISQVLLNEERTILEVDVYPNTSLDEFRNIQYLCQTLGSIELTSNFSFSLTINE